MLKTVVHSKNGMSFTAGTLPNARRFWAFDVKYPENAPNPPDVKEYLLSWLSDADESFKPFIEETQVEDIIKTDIYDTNPLPFYTTRRVVLIGDAAHPMVHHFGQGSCLAIEDAVRLAQHLSECKDASEYHDAFAKYGRLAETIRAAILVRISRLCGDFYLGSGPITNSILRLAFLWPFCLIFVFLMRFLLFFLNRDLRDFSRSLSKLS
jgi:2-polyprenyl-6-methoxyphenol hydroxylase-like FAD-dependent oxidoreductase